MINRDLGELHGPVLLFGGAYSNLAATQSLRAHASRLNISHEQVICNGDIVAYCAEPERTIACIRDWGIAVVMGNCEESLGNNADECGCGFERGTSCALLADEWYSFSSARISTANRQWMQSLPQSITFSFGEMKFLVVHAALDSINRFIFPSTPDDVLRQQFSETAADVVIGGHCGIPFGRRWQSRFWLNTGVIGMPANDGTTDGWYLLLELREERIQARWKRLSYAWRNTQKLMQQAGLDNGYAVALGSGLWPSMDVLPPAERTQRGVALSLAPMLM